MSRRGKQSDPKVSRRGLPDALASGLGTVAPARAYLIGVVSVLILLHGIIPGSFTVDGTTVALLAVLVVLALVPILESATLPGGAGLRFRQQVDRLQQESEIAEAEQEAGRPVSSPPHGSESPESEPDSSQEDSISTPESIIVEILREAARSPKVGLMVLSAELERSVRHLLLASGWGQPNHQFTLRTGVRRLVDLGVLSPSAASALNIYQTVRNEIIHGIRRISDDEVLRAIDATIPLLRAILAIPGEKNVIAHPGVELFSDPAASVPVAGVKGVILETTSPGGLSRSYRIFPTTKADYEVGKQVSWEWGTQQWTETWYRDPQTGEIRKGWDGSMEFRGRHLDDL